MIAKLLELLERFVVAHEKIATALTRTTLNVNLHDIGKEERRY